MNYNKMILYLNRAIPYIIDIKYDIERSLILLDKENLIEYSALTYIYKQIKDIQDFVNYCILTRTLIEKEKIQYINKFLEYYFILKGMRNILIESVREESLFRTDHSGLSVNISVVEEFFGLYLKEYLNNNKEVKE